MNKDIQYDISVNELNTTEKAIIHSIAKLHILAFPEFFLTQLGVHFLETLYRGYVEDEDSGIIVAEENSEIVGFIAYSKDYPGFYNGLIKNHLLKFAFCSLKAAILHPSFIKRLFGAFSKSESVVKEEPYVELASICVKPSSESKGIGSKLISFLIETVDFNKFAYINLETDAENNDGVNKFYQKNGFVLARQYTTREGRVMNEYRYFAGVTV